MITFLSILFFISYFLPVCIAYYGLYGNYKTNGVLTVADIAAWALYHVPFLNFFMLVFAMLIVGDNYVIFKKKE